MAFKVKRPVSEGERIASLIGPVAGQLPRAPDTDRPAAVRQRQVNFKVTREFARLIARTVKERQTTKRQFFAELMQSAGYLVPTKDLENWSEPGLDDDDE